MKRLRILVACETSGAVREAFRRLGHDAISVDLLPSDDNSAHHIISDIRAFPREWFKAFDAGIFFPDCTYLCGSGLHWNKRRPGREQKTDK
jgi:hypothetical protein